MYIYIHVYIHMYMCIFYNGSTRSRSNSSMRIPFLVLSFLTCSLSFSHGALKSG